MAPNGNDDWDVPEDQPSPTSGGSDWETPQHAPPRQDQVPGRYEGGPPATTGGSDLETNDILAIVLAFFLPGIGQLLLGQQVKGLVILALAIFTCSMGGLISVASLLDAFLVAKATKRRQVGEWEFFPDFSETLNL